MKKWFVVALSFVMVLTLVACNKTEYPPGLTQESINATRDAINHVFGEDVIYAEFDEKLEQGGAYIAMVTFDGVNYSNGTAAFDNLCDIINETTALCWEEYGVDTVIVLVNDENVEECLFASENGENITYIFIN